MGKRTGENQDYYKHAGSSASRKLLASERRKLAQEKVAEKVASAPSAPREAPVKSTPGAKQTLDYARKARDEARRGRQEQAAQQGAERARLDAERVERDEVDSDDRRRGPAGRASRAPAAPGDALDRAERPVALGAGERPVGGPERAHGARSGHHVRALGRGSSCARRCACCGWCARRAPRAPRASRPGGVPMAQEASLRAVVGARASRSVDALMSLAVRPLVARARSHVRPCSNGRRWVVVHLDGVSRRTLESAVHRGWAPFLGRLLGSGAYALTPAWSGAPASTPAFQAGLLYGQRHADIPGFTWLDRATRRVMRMDRSDDAQVVEAALKSQGEGLLNNGSASFSVFSGGAPMNAFCRSAWAEDEEVRLVTHRDRWHLAAAAVTTSVLVARLIGGVFQEAGSGLVDLFRQIHLVKRLRHEPTFLLHRIGLSLGAREAATWTAVLDIARGVPGMYLCFGDYDEIAHRRGPDSRLAMLALWGIDRALARIFAAAAAVPEMGYDFFVVADHGQVRTRPFEDAAGLSLVDWLAAAQPSADGGAPRVPDELARSIARMRAVDRAAESLPGEGLRARAREAALEAARAIAHAKGDGQALRRLDEMEVVEAGDIAHVYLGREKRPLQLEEIRRRWPRVLALLVRSPSVGLVAARDGRGTAAWFRGERLDLSDPADAAKLDLGYGGARAAGFVHDVAQLPSAGDLVVYGNGLPGPDVAFPWEFGSHAGIAQQEVETFVVHPARLSGELGHLAHGADLHDFLTGTYGTLPGRTGTLDGAT
ncbi:MAG: cell envelope integrity protein TolA [Myxococcales bacterium]